MWTRAAATRRDEAWAQTVPPPSHDDIVDEHFVSEYRSPLGQRSGGCVGGRRQAVL